MQTNIKIIIDELAGLVSKLSQEDRLLAALELKVHTETVNRYLRGEVKKEAFGLELLAILKKRIAKREKIIA